MRLRPPKIKCSNGAPRRCFPRPHAPDLTPGRNKPVTSCTAGAVSSLTRQRQLEKPASSNRSSPLIFINLGFGLPIQPQLKAFPTTKSANCAPCSAQKTSVSRRATSKKTSTHQSLWQHSNPIAILYLGQNLTWDEPWSSLTNTITCKILVAAAHGKKPSS